MDMSKMGPMARKPTNEAATKKDVEAWLKAEDGLLAAKNWDAMAARVDYPVFMLTDSLQGVPEGELNSKEQYLASMKPFWEGMPPTKTTHKFVISVLSDSLVNVVDDYSTTMGTKTMKGRNTSMVVKVAGAWKFKTMVEAGWGGMGGSAPAPAPSAAPAPAPAPAPAAKTGAAPAPAPAPATGNNRPPPPPAPAPK